jgi:DNA invertase Pin-like site-specific DNA recombinase
MQLGLGYARVSTNEQDTAAQVSALKSAGCERVFEKFTSDLKER